MQETDYYKTFFTRNEGYISDELQQKIRRTTLLIAGCGMGSTIAEAAVRMGVEKIVLADLDIVSIHNLNRQMYVHADIGTKKTESLKHRLLAINPNLIIHTYDEGITPENVSTIVGQSDFIFDTIDFLSLTSIVSLHDEAHKQQKPIISAVSAGFGACAIYFPANNGKKYAEFRELFSLSSSGSVADESYVTHFTHFIQKIHDELDPVVANVMAKALTIMEDGKPCPASQVSAGSFGVASLGVTMFARILNNEIVTTAPQLLVANMSEISASKGIQLTKD